MTEVPFLKSIGSFLTTIWALQAPLAAANKMNATSLAMNIFILIEGTRCAGSPIRLSQLQKVAVQLNEDRPDVKRKFWSAEDARSSHYLRLRLSA
jgi:hypothetical protein